jgi:hypothetical protein
MSVSAPSYDQCQARRETRVRIMSCLGRQTTVVRGGTLLRLQTSFNAPERSLKSCLSTTMHERCLLATETTLSVRGSLFAHEDTNLKSLHSCGDGVPTLAVFGGPSRLVPWARDRGSGSPHSSYQRRAQSRNRCGTDRCSRPCRSSQYPRKSTPTVAVFWVRVAEPALHLLDDSGWSKDSAPQKNYAH